MMMQALCAHLLAYFWSGTVPQLTIWHGPRVGKLDGWWELTMLEGWHASGFMAYISRTIHGCQFIDIRTHRVYNARVTMNTATQRNARRNMPTDTNILADLVECNGISIVPADDVFPTTNDHTTLREDLEFAGHDIDT